MGRHNAVDKVVGWAALEGRLPLSGRSARAAAPASRSRGARRGIVLASISGPSSLAVELARENGLTLCAFLRGEAFTVYAGAERIKSP